MRCLHPLVSTWAESINFPSSVNCEIMYDVDIRKPGNEEINQLFSFKRSKPQALLGSRIFGITLNQITSWVDWKVICFFCLVLLNMHADYLIISDMKKVKNIQCNVITFEKDWIVIMNDFGLTNMALPRLIFANGDLRFCFCL